MFESRPHVVHVSKSPLKGDARVKRAIAVDEKLGLKVSVLANGDQWMVKTLHLARKAQFALTYGILGRLGSRWALRCYWSFAEHQKALAQVLAQRPDLIHAHDWDALPIAAVAAERLGIPFIYNAHEYAIDTFADRRLWQLTMSTAIGHIEHKFAPSAALMITVSDYLAEAMRRRLNTPAKPLVVRNIPETVPVASTAKRADCILLHYHGVLSAGRGIETAIRALRHLPPEYRLRLVGPWTQTAFEKQVYSLIEESELSDRVDVCAAVPATQLASVASDADIGLILLNGNTVHDRGALPNKFFEYLHAGLYIVASGSEEMKNLLLSYDCGECLHDKSPETLARVLQHVSGAQLEAGQKNAKIAARSLSMNQESQELADLYEIIMP